MSGERRRLALGLLLSLLIHALLLSLTFGGQELGFPGFGFPWQERRVEAPELRVVLVPPPATAARAAATSVAEPSPSAPITAPIAERPVQGPAVSTMQFQRQTADAIVPEAEPTPVEAPPRDRATLPADAKASLRANRPTDAAPASIPEPDVIAVERPDEATFVAPRPPPASSPVVAALPDAASPERLEAARAEAARLETERQEAARQEAARVDAARAEVTRAEAERQAAREQAEVRQETARQEAARLEASRAEASRAEAARAEAARAETTRAEVERQESARVRAAQKDTDSREAARQAMGRKLDEEAAQRDAAAIATNPPDRRPPSWSSARRGRLFGRADANAELVLYAEAWARKIQFNTSVDVVRDVAKRARVDPLVTVAIRRDGSVESVTFVLSSGVPEIDEAIRRIVQSQAPYQAFTPGLAREFDVIEIRRTWYFDAAVRLY